MQNTVLAATLAAVLALSALQPPVYAADLPAAGGTGNVEDYTTTAYAPWWSLYHLTSANAAAAGIVGGEGGQMIHAMAVSSDGAKLYYGTDTGGIWTSDDGGANWRISQTGFIVNGAVDIAIDPDNSSIAFAAGMLCAGASTNENTGIYRTIDGGAHWSLVLNTDYYYIFTNKVIKFGAKHTDGHRTIYAGTHSKGVFTSDDGGNTWINIGCVGNRIEDLYVDPSNADSPVIAAASQESGVTVSADGGKTWTNRNNGLPSAEILSLTVNPADSSNWFVTVNMDQKLYTTADMGNSWTAAGDMKPALIESGQPYKLNFGAWDGTNTPVLYIALSANPDCVRYSADLGRTFMKPVYDQTLALRDQRGYWPEAMAVDPVNPWTCWAAVDGVIYKSSNSGSVLFSPSCGGSSGMRNYDMTFDNDGNIQYIGVMDHGIYKAASGYNTDYPPVTALDTVQRWNGVWSCLGLAMDPNDSRHVFAKVGDWGGNMIIEETKDGGDTWAQISGTGGNYGILINYNNKNSQVIYAGKLRSGDNGKTWITLPMEIAAVSPVDNNVVYAVGGAKIYKSTNMGDTWAPLAPIIGDGIQFITADGLKSDRVWVGTFNNGMYRIDADTATHIGSGQLRPSINGNYGIFKVAQDPNNPFHYAAAGCDNTAHGPGAGLFESFDGGDTWSLVPDMPGMKDVWTLRFNPVKPLVYVCTSNGTIVYDWSKRPDLNTNPPITPVPVGVYSEDFNDGLAQGWTLNGYQTDADNKVFYTGDWGTPFAVYDWQAASAPFEYKVDAVTYCNTDSDRMRIIFNYRDESNYNYFDFGSSEPPDTPHTAALKKVADGVESTIVSKEISYNFNSVVSTIDINCSADGKVSVDAIRNGNAVNIFTAAEDNTFLLGGKVGVGAEHCASGFFDNVHLMSVSAMAEPVQTYDIVNYMEDFESGQAADWSLSSGLAVESGTLYTSDPNGHQIGIYNTGIATTPFELKADILTWHGSDGNKMRVYFNYQDSMSCEYIQIGGGNTPTIELKKVINGAESTIATYSGVYSFFGDNGFTTIDIICGNDGLFNISAIRNGVTAPLFTDVTDPAFASGKIGVGSDSGFIAVDKIEVNSLAPAGPIVYYTENFRDNAAQGWIYTDGIIVDQQCMHVDTFGDVNMGIYDSQAVYAPYNYQIDFFMWPTGNKDGVKIVFGYKDSDNYNCLLLGGGSDPSKIVKVAGGNATVLATSSVQYDFSNSGTNATSNSVNNTFSIHVDADGMINIDVTRNGITTPLFANVPDPEATSGKIGVGTDHLGSLFWTNIIVTGTEPGTKAVVGSVSVTPEAITLNAGDTFAFSAVVNGTDNPPQNVTWTVEGGNSADTVISDNGVLTVAPDETADVLTVKAASSADNTKYAGAAVTVTPSAPAFVSVNNITGVPLAIVVGTHVTIVGTVEPSDATNQTIDWSIKDAGGTDAVLSGSALIAMAEGEMVVTATISDGISPGTDYVQDFVIKASDIVSEDTPTPTPTDSPTATPTDSPTATPTDSPTATPGIILPIYSGGYRTSPALPPTLTTPVPTPTLPPALSPVPPYVPSVDKKTAMAGALHKLGLFVDMGTDEKGAPIYELDKKLTRIEALALVLRLMGLETEADAYTGACAFTDVPDWGVKYAAYAYNAGITAGVNDTHTLFAPDRQATFHEFTAFLLRVLGYTEANGDFQYDQAIQKASSVGLFSPYDITAMNTADFLRGDAVLVMSDALVTNRKDVDRTLLYMLIDKGVISKADAEWFLSVVK